ncbi:AIM24 family protein [Candidatus Pacearchaeota archaeon]|nr:AIM24 family protein [Candidatus Pacearchaeota archaeon]
MDYRFIHGSVPLVEVILQKDQKITSIKNGSYVSSRGKVKAKSMLNIRKGHILSGNVVTTEYSALSDSSIIFSPIVCDGLEHLTLSEGEKLIVERDNLFLADSTVKLSGYSLRNRMNISLLRTLISDLDVFPILVNGPGDIIISGYGGIVKMDLENIPIKIDGEHIIAYDPAVNTKLVRVGGLREILFSREGFSHVEMGGRGKVYLQHGVRLSHSSGSGIIDLINIFR